VVVNMLFSEVGDQMLSESGGSENRVISDMQVINFLTGEFIVIAKVFSVMGSLIIPPAPL
jgi:hypothetical protein